MFNHRHLAVLLITATCSFGQSTDNDSVKILDLSNKGLTSLDSFNCSHYPQLEELDLSQNKLRSLKENVFKKCRHLNKLSLSGNLELQLPEFSTLLIGTIRDLDLTNCNINHVPQSLFDGLTQLQFINLERNPLKELEVFPFSNIQTVEHIIIPGHTQFSARQICEELPTLTIEVRKKKTTRIVRCADEHGKVNDDLQTEEVEYRKREVVNVDVEQNATEEAEAASKTDNQPPQSHKEPVENPATAPPVVIARGISPSANETTQTQVQPSGEAQPKSEEKSQVPEPLVVGHNVEFNSTIEENSTVPAANPQEKPPTGEKVEGKSPVSETILTLPEKHLESPGNASKVEENPETTAINTTQPTTEAVPQVAETAGNSTQVEATTISDLNADKTLEEATTPDPSKTITVEEKERPEPSLVRKINVELNSSTVTHVENVENRKMGGETGAAEIADLTKPIEPEDKPHPIKSATPVTAGSNILIGLVVAVIILGALAFAYKLYRTRHYRAAHTEEPPARELDEIKVHKQPVVAEEQPLMDQPEKMCVDDKEKNGPQSNGVDCNKAGANET